MNVYILIPEGKGGQSILVKGADNVIATLKTTRFFFLKSYSDGTPLNGYFIDEALTDEFRNRFIVQMPKAQDRDKAV